MGEGASQRAETWGFAAAAAAVVALCLTFRYLPMMDVPEHAAMTSIIALHDDPVRGFQERFTFDFLKRPYLTVYFAAAGLSWLTGVRVALRVAIALCTVAPLLGLWLLLREARRPRVWAIALAPLCFGNLWHWGFLNFLLGTGLMLAGLALAVRLAFWPTALRTLALAALAPVVLVTHFHAFALLVLLAPVAVLGYAHRRWRALLLAAAALLPSVAAFAALVVVTWGQAPAEAPALTAGPLERALRFPEFLAAGLPAPWAELCAGALALLAVLAFLLRERKGERAPLLVLGALVAAQVALYFALPLNAPTATYLSPRQALLAALALPLLLPAPGAKWRWLAWVTACALAAGGLGAVAVHLKAFDEEAREVDPVLEAMAPNRRVVALLFDRRSRHAHPATLPYHHFAAWYQADKGGDVSFSFARLWNIPVKYRQPPYALRPAVEWQPLAFSLARDLPHFDYVLVRSHNPPGFPIGTPLKRLAASGPWSVWERTGP